MAMSRQCQEVIRAESSDIMDTAKTMLMTVKRLDEIEKRMFEIRSELLKNRAVGIQGALENVEQALQTEHKYVYDTIKRLGLEK